MFLVTPYGLLPMLVADRRKVAQSTAICRYLAKQYDLAGKTDWANLHIDATVDTIHDIRHSEYPVLFCINLMRILITDSTYLFRYLLVEIRFNI